ncbi:hypothetical protein phi3396_12 [Streptococcus phage phi3396]|uniref:hypothetical protein n=1 Tax=Streptococcus phage phi3396 TaxID=423476 RepID=UPI0000F0E8A4|nr:hypothetical protein phi3396_12 [Streptococcus phage phi3396]ABN10785.1 hypothetical protein phi3396_12 [Streptococcus phage phi3396]
MTNFDHYFSNHIAEKIELDTATIIDYYNPKYERMYNLRYIFDKKNSSLCITGDFGELVAVNFYNMGDWDTFYRHFTNNPDYFIEKVSTSRRSLFVHDIYEAQKVILKEFFNGKDYEDLDWDESCIYDDLFEYFHDQYGFRHMSDDTREFLSSQQDEYYVTLEYAGRRISDVVFLYLDAYKRAYEYLKKGISDGK